jgi:hypothetical protein
MSGTKRRSAVSFAIVVLLIGAPASVWAHRLDEYLQATRILVGVEDVSIELDLTPGTSVAPEVFASIDTDRNGRVSAPERDAYARRVVESVALKVDDRQLPLSLLDSQFPEYQEMDRGVGMIRLRAQANLTASIGDHQLYYLNDYRPDMGAYLVNALVPDDRQVQIGKQRRDPGQHTLTFDYHVGAPARSFRAVFWLFLAVVLSGFGISAGSVRRRASARTSC